VLAAVTVRIWPCKHNKDHLSVLPISGTDAESPRCYLLCGATLQEGSVSCKLPLLFKFRKVKRKEKTAT